MSKRSQIKRITTGARTLKLLREQAKLSLRKAAMRSQLSDSLIAHLEQGRMDIHERHLQTLLPVYGSTLRTYEMFASGSVKVPQNLRWECAEVLKSMSLEQLRTAHTVLLSLANQK